MPIYTYRCDNKDCSHEFEISQSIKANRKRKCPECGELSLDRILYASHGFMKKSADEMGTVYDLARHNTDKLSNWEKQERDASYMEGSKLARSKIERQKAEKPWWHQTLDKTSQSEINKMTPTQKKKYIEKGTK